MATTEPRFATREPVDFVIVGSGAAGGVLARELSTDGFDVVLLEQGPYLRAGDFRHDELGYVFNQELTGGWQGQSPQTFRKTESDKAELRDFPPPAVYARLVGGSSVHFTANYWRFHDVDFKERSLLGPIAGTGFADWPIDYDEL
ncbi:MAG TPA: NAD(P)-binding protein, partial [Gammaproteobacteria bacterium]|nr:NAD(P)-binding protein [Gammaproteobacteria bacterium]